MSNSLRITTFNIHKGLSSLRLRSVLREQRELIRQLRADIVFLQETCGTQANHGWPSAGSQHEYLADAVWKNFVYGKNASGPVGDHGNALLSRFPIGKWENQNISAHSIEQRGILHCEINITGWSQPLHCLCIHLGLFSGWRRQQLFSLRKRIEDMVPVEAPLIIAGDFNDWRVKAGHVLGDGLHLKEVFEHMQGRPARSFPSILPLFRLDRIYVRGFHVDRVKVHGAAFNRASDHTALTAELIRL